MIEIDGSQGEGGGQILRTALAASIITGQPVHIDRIRAGRRKPGLAAQHLAGVLAAAKISKAAVSGAKIGSTEIAFQPGGAAQSGDYHFDISIMAGRGSAGAVTLLLQSILLPLALADGPSRVTIRGGTHVPLSPRRILPSMSCCRRWHTWVCAPRWIIPSGAGIRWAGVRWLSMWMAAPASRGWRSGSAVMPAR